MITDTSTQTGDMLLLDNVLFEPSVRSVKQLHQELARQAGMDLSIPPHKIYEARIKQDGQSLCGVGHGVAIPHLRLENTTQPYSLFVKLKTPIDYNSIDGKPVDLVLLMTSPAGNTAHHLYSLSRMTRMLRSKSLQKKLRGIDNSDAVRAIFISTDAELKAA